MRFILLALLVVGLATPATASSDGLKELLQQDFAILKKVPAATDGNRVVGNPTPTGLRETSEIRWAMVLAVRLYQQVLSSQDEPSCTFTPSCSRFGVTALKEAGLFQGFLMTLDRLQRCHGFNRPYYAVDAETGRLYDSVEHNHLW